MNTAPSITDTLTNMFNQSIQVISKPSVATFEQFENKGTLREAVIYVLTAGIIVGLLKLGGRFWRFSEWNYRYHYWVSGVYLSGALCR